MEQLIEKTIAFTGKKSIRYITSDDDFPEDIEENMDYVELMKKGKLVFFPYMLADDNTVETAEGNKLSLSKYDIPIGIEECLGFLVGIKNECFTFYFAFDEPGGCMAPPPSIIINGNVGDAKPHMEKYIQSFKKTG